MSNKFEPSGLLSPGGISDDKFRTKGVLELRVLEFIYFFTFQKAIKPIRT